MRPSIWARRPRPPAGEQTNSLPAGIGTEADRLRQHYQQIGAAENHKFGEGLPGSKPPDFNLKLPPTRDRRGE